MLDVPALRRAGTAPVPFHQFVLKLHSRCNLLCSYCYVYTAADTSWRRRPARVTEAVLTRSAERIGEHVATHRLSRIRVELHGGEPLLGGAETALRQAAEVRAAVRAASATDCEVQVSVQTNGTLLTPDVVRRLAAGGIRVGVSLDGGRPDHNKRRVDHAGRPSWHAATRGLAVLAGHPETYAGILCTIDLDLDPVEVYDSLLEFRPAALDLLLPHANWASPPPGKGPSSAGSTPYGEWLAHAFDRWFDGGRYRTRIRLFTEIIGLLLGFSGGAEAVGLSPVAAVLVETDGGIEQVDSLKAAYQEAPATGMDVFSHSFDDVLEHPGIAARQLGADALSDECRSCPLLRVCGGGHYAHRYRRGSGFRNRSVYCADLDMLIRHIARRLEAVLGIDPLLSG
ncbi:FxsB family cyclophane-forming radical SAM/SPASM peptide maturase [Streptomyces sp. A012304]|uniref:FxsB family cyclophane-forming radical SAM/SPASM peptide maturase n=1 Tax=Streptomyces sp. A012304 TaxID=375446 RepID=UPI00222E9380|nr:FxsB family cyclophane-forming radical SAM/SPASM peptide maturase [Streptomyces sp. A012304]